METTKEVFRNEHSQQSRFVQNSEQSGNIAELNDSIMQNTNIKEKKDLATSSSLPDISKERDTTESPDEDQINYSKSSSLPPYWFSSSKEEMRDDDPEEKRNRDDKVVTEENSTSLSEKRPASPLEERAESPNEEILTLPIEGMPQAPNEESLTSPIEGRPESPNKETLTSPIEERPGSPIEKSSTSSNENVQERVSKHEGPFDPENNELSWFILHVCNCWSSIMSCFKSNPEKKREEKKALIEKDKEDQEQTKDVAEKEKDNPE